MKEFDLQQDYEDRMRRVLDHVHRVHAGQIAGIPDSVLGTKLRRFGLEMNENTLRDLRDRLDQHR